MTHDEQMAFDAQIHAHRSPSGPVNESDRPHYPADPRYDLSDENVAGLIDALTYSSYRHNREISPEVTPERWRKVFGPSTDAMEQKYQGEKR